MARKRKTTKSRRTTKARDDSGASPGGKAEGKPAVVPAGAISEPAVGDLLNMDQAIAMLKTTRPTFYRWLRAGRIKGMKVGRQWRFRTEDLERFLTGQQVQIDLPASIDPLVALLRNRLEKTGHASLDRVEVAPVSESVDLAVRAMVLLLVRLNASDIHTHPKGPAAVVRMRVDGMLLEVAEFDLRLLSPLVDAWKTLASCDLHEHQRPQDGSVSACVDESPLDMRVNIMPAQGGPSLTVRRMHNSINNLTLDMLEINKPDRQRIERWINTPSGFVLVNGPTGCGKSTTLYCCLSEINQPDRKIVTLEDPIDVVMPGLIQSRVDTEAGMTFEAGIRMALRGDPDVICVGEIRNRDTMLGCIQAALGGHLVFSVLHADDSVAALKRITDLGVDPFMVGDALKLIVSQRLLRRLCPECSCEVEPSREQLERAEGLARLGGLKPNQLNHRWRAAVGCAKCAETGYRGRFMVTEALEMSGSLAAALDRGATREKLHAIAIGQGMTTLVADGVRRASEGDTTLDEVFRCFGSATAPVGVSGA